jgi:hypothetical protein
MTVFAFTRTPFPSSRLTGYPDFTGKAGRREGSLKVDFL